jgi:hypothetical protein
VLEFIGAYLAGALLYLAPTLGLLIPAAVKKNHAENQYNETFAAYQNNSNFLLSAQGNLLETVTQIDSIPCVKAGLDAFKNSTAAFCTDPLSLMQLGLNLTLGVDSRTLQTEQESRQVNCRNVRSGSNCHRTSKVNRCSPTYRRVCDAQYYTRTEENIFLRNGTWVTGNGVHATIECSRFGAQFSVSATSHMDSSTQNPWTDELRRRTEDWSSQLLLTYTLANQSISQNLVLNKQSNLTTSSDEILDFATPLCEQIVRGTEQITSGYWDDKNESLTAQRVIQAGLLASLLNTTAILKNSSDAHGQTLHDRDNAYRAALKIHLPILFVGAPIVAMISLGLWKCFHVPVARHARSAV